MKDLIIVKMVIVSGNFWSDLTDHLPNYFLITSNRRSKKSERPLVRIFSERNVNDFKSRLSGVEWHHVYNNSTDINDGYDYMYFESKISYCYQNSFKLVKSSRKRSKDKNGSQQVSNKVVSIKIIPAQPCECVI